MERDLELDHDELDKHLEEREFDTEESLAAAVVDEHLMDERKSHRNSARKVLLQLDDEAVLEALPRALHGSRKHMRLAAARVLSSLSTTYRRHRLAQRALFEEHTDDIREVLRALEPPDETWTVERDAIIGDLDDDFSNWRHWIDEAGPELVRVFVAYVENHAERWIQNRHVCEERDDSWMVSSIRSEFEALLESVPDRPQTRQYALRFLSLFSPEKPLGTYRQPVADEEAYIDVLRSVAERLERVGEELEWLYVSEQLDDFDLDLVDLVSYSKPRVPEVLGPMLASALDDDDLEVRRRAKFGLADLGPSAVDEVVEALVGDTTADGREAAAWLLGVFCVPETIEILEEARADETSQRVEESIDQAITRCRHAALDVDDFDRVDALDDALAALDLTPLSYNDLYDEDEERPELRWETGEPLSDGATDWMWAQLARISKHTSYRRLLASVYDVWRRVDDCTRHRVGKALKRRFEGERRQKRLLGAVGYERHLDELGRLIEGQDQELSRREVSNIVQINRIYDVCKALGWNVSNRALHWLDHWEGSVQRRDTRAYGHYREALDDALAARDLETHLPALEAAPDFGFDVQREQRIDYGPREIVVRLEADGTLHFVDDEGDVHDSLPPARETDDQGRVEEAHTRYWGLESILRDFLDLHTRRLEEAMMIDERWTVETWRAICLEHPMTLPVAHSLIFEWRGESEASFQFSPSAPDTILGPQGDELVLPDDGEIRLAHPVELDNDRRAMWRNHFEERDERAPFPYLDRAVHGRREGIGDDDIAVYRTSTYCVDVEQHALFQDDFEERLEALEYKWNDRDDFGEYRETIRSIGPIRLHMHHTESFSSEHSHAQATLHAITVCHEREGRLCHSDVPNRLWSEVVRDARYVMGDDDISARTFGG